MSKHIALQLDAAACREALLARLRALEPSDARRWGRMNAHQAVCHLRDSFRSRIHHEPITARDNLFTRTFVRWIALHTGLPWPHGVRTVPEVDQERGGTRPVDFARDRAELLTLIEQFVPLDAARLGSHPIFGPLTTPEWQHWAWRHIDHHLRQFGR